ncbi:MAG: adenylate/guanylate cyclase domain-containing protein [Acidobacteria bacterium]|nr:adenylate/guanylate cyclase domain-containing protein [Acidobacteriota bacterium]
MPDRRASAKLILGLGLGFAAGLAAWLLSLLPFLQTIELKTYDWRLRATARPTRPADAVVLVMINDDSIRRLEPNVGRWPWPRLVHASLIDFLARAPAKVIVYDVLFPEADTRRFTVGEDEWTGAQSDRALADSMAKAGTVVLAADVADEGLLDASKNLQVPLDAIPSLNHAFAADSCIEPRPVLAPPIEPLSAVARAMGHTYTLLDSDGPVRRTPPFIRVGERVVPSLALAATMVAKGLGAESVSLTPTSLTVGSTRVPTFVDTVDNYYGAPFQSCRTLIAYRGPIHANVIDSLLSARSIAPAGARVAFASIVGVALAVGLVGGLGSTWITGICAIVIAGLVTWTSLRLFAGGLWVPLVAPLLGVALAFTGDLAWHYFVEGREKRQVKKLFSRYVAKDVFDRLMTDPSLAALGGARRTMTVLFSDVRGFTAMSEKGTPEAVVGQLNEYFTRMVAVLFEHRGTLDKFVGDMVMALFGAPLDDPDHADHAVQTAIAMSAALDELNDGWRAAGQPALDIGIGINTGDMVAGNIGSDTIMSYTVIGDAVNLGARLESLNKDYGTRVIISESTRAALKGRYDIRPLGTVLVKGKSQPVEIFDLRGPAQGHSDEAQARRHAPHEVKA